MRRTKQIRSIGTSVSSAVLGMVLADTSVTMGSVRVPSMEGVRISFLIATGAVLIGLVLAASLPSQRPSGHPVLLASSTDAGPAPVAPVRAAPGATAGRSVRHDGAPSSAAPPPPGGTP